MQSTVVELNIISFSLEVIVWRYNKWPKLKHNIHSCQMLSIPSSMHRSVLLSDGNYWQGDICLFLPKNKISTNLWLRNLCCYGYSHRVLQEWVLTPRKYFAFQHLRFPVPSSRQSMCFWLHAWKRFFQLLIPQQNTPVSHTFILKLLHVLKKAVANKWLNETIKHHYAEH